MFTVEYWVGAKLVESWLYPSLPLANWKKKMLLDSGQYQLGRLRVVKPKH